MLRDTSSASMGSTCRGGYPRADSEDGADHTTCTRAVLLAVPSWHESHQRNPFFDATKGFGGKN